MSIQRFMGKWLFAMVKHGERIQSWHANGLECPACGSTDTYGSLAFIEVENQEISLLMCDGCECVTGVFVDGILEVEVDDA